jgi:GNAT superfamily N-acetyltransferase
MDVQARPATVDDLPMLVELYRAYRSALVDERGGATHLLKEAFSEPLGDRFSSIVGDDQWLVLVGTFDEAAAGLSAARIETLPDGSLLVTVEVIYVDPQAREVGVGEELLHTVMRWATEHAAAGVDVRVLPGMRASKNFLEGSGFAARLLVMHHKLQGSGETGSR